MANLITRLHDANYVFHDGRWLMGHNVYKPANNFIALVRGFDDGPATLFVVRSGDPDAGWSATWQPDWPTQTVFERWFNIGVTGGPPPFVVLDGDDAELILAKRVGDDLVATHSMRLGPLTPSDAMKIYMIATYHHALMRYESKIDQSCATARES